MTVKREFIESPLAQGEDERIAYQLTTTNWGGSPSDVVVTLKTASGLTAGTDVSATKLTGAATVAGDVITTPVLHDLDPMTHYRLEIQFVSGGNTWEAWGIVQGEV